MLVAIFLAGITRLFMMRFESGDIYAAYSSLRTDPLGAKVLYNSLGSIGIKTSRNYKQDYQSFYSAPEGKTFLFIGIHRSSLTVTQDQARLLDEAVAGGGRLVVLLYPEAFPDMARNGRGENQEMHEDAQPEAPPGITPEGNKSRKEERPGPPDEDKRKDIYAPRYVDLPARWGFDLGNVNAADIANSASPETGVKQAAYGTEAVAAGDGSGLAPQISWHSSAYFKDFDKGWKVLYELNSNPALPVMMEKHFGNGDIIAATDSYFASNEAMLKERHPRLLSFLIGNGRQTVFDEYHLGVVKNPGVAALWRRYHLDGLLAGLALLFVLFLWENSTSLVPPQIEDEAAGSVSGVDSISGLTNLLRRNIAPSRLMDVCCDELEKRNPLYGNREAHARKARAARQAVQQAKSEKKGAANPVSTYNQLRKIFSERGDFL